MPTYTQTNFKDNVFDSTLDADISSALTVQDLLNRAARIVNGEIDLRSAKRRSTFTPNIFDDVYEYTCPTDLKDRAIIDLIPQTNRSLDSKLFLVSQEVFDRKKSIYKNMVAFSEDDFTRKVKADLDVDDEKLVVSNLDSLTAGGGTWATFSAGSTNVAADTANYVEGSGSIKFDLASGTTTAGIVNTDLNDLDISDYVNAGSLFVWAYINSTTNLTNFIVRIGNDSSNYYTQTITTTNEGTSFVTGWNLLRFDFASMTETGTVSDTAVDYCAIYMTKTSGKNDAGYRFDNIQLHTGQIFDILYYSKYPWQTSGGSYIENSTTSTDKVNADTEEFDLFVYKAKEMAAIELLRDINLATYFGNIYKDMKKDYINKHPSERVKEEAQYY